MKKHKIMVPVYMTEPESEQFPMLCAAAGFDSVEDLRQYLNGRKLFNERWQSATVQKRYPFTAGALMIRSLKRAFLQFKEAYPDLVFNIEDDGGLLEREFLVTVAGYPPDVERFDKAMRLWIARVRRELE